MRQTPKPWEAIGMSRATWYRRGKPTEKPKRLDPKRFRNWHKAEKKRDRYEHATE